MAEQPKPVVRRRFLIGTAAAVTATAGAVTVGKIVAGESNAAADPMNSDPVPGRKCMTTHVFTNVRSVAVPVTDQDRTRGDLEQLGFRVSMDAELRPGFRWIEMELPGGEASIALVTAGPELPSGIDTGIRLATDDARAARDAVEAAGLHADDLLDWPGVPLMFSFSDADGNRFYVSEVASR